MAGAYYGEQGQPNAADELGSLLPLFHEIRNRNLADYKDKAQFDSDLAIRQERARSMFDPSGASMSLSTVGGGNGRTTNNNISYGITPPNPEIKTSMTASLSPAEQAKFGLDKAGLELDKEKLKQQGKIGEERLGIMQERENLNREKTGQIHDTKMADMQRKVDESTQRMALAYDQLQSRKDDSVAHQNFLDAKQKADDARHALDLAQKDRQLSDTEALHKAQIAEMQHKYDTIVKTTGITFDDKGNPIQKKETTDRQPQGKNSAFNSSTTKAFTDKNGTKYNIPMDKIDAFKKDNPDAQEVK